MGAGGITVRDLPALVISSGSSPVSAGIGHLDDANAITVYLSTAQVLLSSTIQIEVSQFDPADVYPVGSGITQSSAWYPLTTALTSGVAGTTITNIAFRGLRIRTSANSLTTGTVLAFATKQIWI